MTNETTNTTTSNLDKVQDVRIYDEDTYKFIVVRITEQNGNQKLVIRAANRNRCGYHREILAELRDEIWDHQMNSRCIGGGRMNFDRTSGRISIWDYSGDFGREPDRELTAEMLRAAYPNFQVEVGEY